MRMILAPAKRMYIDGYAEKPRELPALLDKTRRILECLRGMTPTELQSLWKCNDQIAAQNVERLRGMDLEKNLTPAVLAYDGIAFKCMAPQVFTRDQEAYVGERLRILSGFYGILRPFDGVTPYRLEMQARLSLDGARDLYEFWGASLAEILMAETDTIIDLASKEYSKAIVPHLRDTRVITCVFGELKAGKVVEKATLCKMARGEMVRYMAEINARRPEDMREFDRYGFRYSPERSKENTYVFVRQGGKSHA